MSEPRILPFGATAVLVEVADTSEVVRLIRRLGDPPEGVTDIVPAARTILVQIDPRRTSLSTVTAWVMGTDHSADAKTPPPSLVLDVSYIGEDLSALAGFFGVTDEEVVARHVSASWEVAFTGFAPGFGYLLSEDWPFDVPRLATPRTRVPAGAVGLAGAYTGCYPRATPGGWQLIGHTDAVLFDVARERPALLSPGANVRFRASRERIVAAPPASRPPTHASGALEVVVPGPLTTVQDLGRTRLRADGVATAGAADRAAFRLANRLVGNPEASPALEVTVGGLRLRVHRTLVFVVTGAWGPVRIDGRDVDPYVAHSVSPGAEIAVGPFVHGVRAYVAVLGGIDALPVLGSASTDTLSGLGPGSLVSGDRLDVAEVSQELPVLEVYPWGPPPDDTVELELEAGPRADWFTADAHALLYDAEWAVTADTSRVGVRLSGPTLARARSGELPSEGMLPGAIQVPPDGQPVILGPDGPVTGGYPVVAVVSDATRDRIAQARPGTRVRFRHARTTGRSPRR